MRKIKEVLRLFHDAGLGQRQIARSLRMSSSTVREYLRRAEDAGLAWPLPAGLDESALERRLFPPPDTRPARLRPLPDWSEVHRELKRKGVTLSLLWQEYKAAYPEGLQYSRYCDHYRSWAAKLDLVMRQSHRAGEKLFVDYAGQSIPVVERSSGEIRQVQIFVAVLGASSYTYAEATWTQSLADWVGSHTRALEFLGAVPEIVVPDNVRSAVSKACRYEPDLNPTYAEWASHYSVAVIPARIRKPRDKAKVEVAVQLVERWILARLRHHTFFSLDELNDAIASLLAELNNKPFKKLPESRRALFEQLERPAMRPLPAERYVYAQWFKARVNIDYHVAVAEHYYSVPYQLVSEQLDVRLTANTVEVLHRARRVASHRRSYRQGAYTTLAEHMPKAHREYARWTPERLVRWAHKTGPATAELLTRIMTVHRHPQQGFRSCLGILRLGQRHGTERCEAACRRALAIGALSYRSVHSILKHGLDRQPLGPSGETPLPPIAHANIRGAQYYDARNIESAARREKSSP